MKGLTETNMANKNLLSSTNSLLTLVGITAKPITSINELKRVASSMFVAIFEALFRTRVEGVVRRPKDTFDYISNCQVILDSLSRQLQMDLRHITGESIIQGDRRAISNLVNILLRIATITGRGSGQNDMNRFIKSKGSESISSHESAFAHLDGEIMESANVNSRVQDTKEINENTEHIRDGQDHECDIPATNDAHLWNMSFLGTNVGEDDNNKLANRKEHHESEYHDMFGKQLNASFVGIGNKVDIANFKSMLSEFEQHNKVKAARQRREEHIKKKVYQASIRNNNSVQKSFEICKKQWAEDNKRDEYASLLRRKNEEYVMVRQVQKALLKQMRTGELDQCMETKERINDIKQEATWHFQSLQTLFYDHVKNLRMQETDMRKSNEDHVNNYKLIHNEIRRFNQLKQRKALRDSKRTLKQKQLYSSQIRKDTHQQLLSYLELGNEWESSLRASWPPPTSTTSSIAFDMLRPNPFGLAEKDERAHSPKHGKAGGKKKAQQRRPKSAPLVRQF